MTPTTTPQGVCTVLRGQLLPTGENPTTWDAIDHMDAATLAAAGWLVVFVQHAPNVPSGVYRAAPLVLHVWHVVCGTTHTAQPALLALLRGHQAALQAALHLGGVDALAALLWSLVAAAQATPPP